MDFNKILLCLLFFFAVHSVNGQFGENVNLQNMDKEGLLSNNYINDIATDHLGVFWIATNGGLFRYDSPQHVKRFLSGDIGLNSDIITTLKATSDNALWIGTTFGGVTRYDIESNESKTYSSDSSTLYSLTNSEILDIEEISENEIWVATELGIDVIYTDTDSIFNFNLHENTSFKHEPSSVLEIYKDSKGWIWFSTWDAGFYLYIPHPSGNHSLGKFKEIQIPEIDFKSNIWEIEEHTPNQYWVATHNWGLGVFRIPENLSPNVLDDDWQPEFKFFQVSDDSSNSLALNYVRALEFDSQDNLWIGTSNGLSILSKAEIAKIDWTIPKQNLSFNSYYQKPYISTGLNDSNITALHLGGQGLMWIGNASGINQYNKLNNQFTKYTIESLSDNLSLGIGRVNEIHHLNADTILIGTNGSGLFGFDVNKKRLYKSAKIGQEYKDERITSMYLDDNFVYLGNEKDVKRISKFEPYNTITYPIIEYINSIKKPKGKDVLLVTEILKDRSGRLWVGTENELILIDEESNTYTIVLTDKTINKAFEDSNGTIWLCTYRGIVKIKTIENNFEEELIILGEGEYSNIKVSNQIITVDEYQNTLYFGGLNGIVCYDLLKEQFYSFENEVTKKSINNLSITDKGVMWAGTPNGLLKYDLHSNSSVLYGPEEGLPMIFYRKDSNREGIKNNFYVGAQGGFYEIQNQAIEVFSSDHDVFITSVKDISTDSTYYKHTIKKENVDISSSNLSLEIEFSSNNYSRPHLNEYAYRLKGFDDDWKFTSTQSVGYTNLNPGKYTFEVKTKEYNREWSNKLTSLKINVLYSWWETTLFKLALLALFLCIVFFFVKYYIRTIYNRNTILEEYNTKLNQEIQKTEIANKSLEERDKVLQQLVNQLDESNKELKRSNTDLKQFAYITSHDLQEPLNTVKAFSGLLRDTVKDKDEPEISEFTLYIEEGVNRMSELIKGVLAYSIIGRTKSIHSKTDLNEIVHNKIKDLKEYIQKKNAKVEVSDLPKIICVKEQIGTVFYNLILNGLKFNKSDIPEVRISASETEEFWVFKVKDNGIGIPSSHHAQIFGIFKRLHRRNEFEGTGIGLSICEKIISYHNGVIEVDSVEKMGSTFTFTISKNLADS